MSDLYIPTSLQEYKELVGYLGDVKVKSLSMWEELMRWYSLNDMFFFLNFVLTDGKHLHSTYQTPIYLHDFYLKACKQVQWQLDNLESSFDGSARRGSKSTIRTKAASIQMGLKYPDISINIASVEKQLAKKHLRLIKEELETNQLLKVLFSDVLHDDPQAAAKNGETVWSLSDGLRFKRKASRANQTIECNNFLSGPVGSGYDILHFDDCENEKMTSGQDQILKLHDAFDAMIAVATPFILRKPIIFVTNTLYHPEGIAQRKLKEYKKHDERCVRLVPAEDRKNPGDCPGGGTAIYPFTADILWQKYNEAKDKDAYFIQYCCDFQTGQDRRLERAWFGFYDESQEKVAKGKNGYLCIDASRGVYDPMGIWGWASGVDKRLYWVDGSRKKLDPASPAFADEIFIIASRMANLCERLVEIRVEQMGSQTWAELIGSELRKRGMYVPVVPCRGKLSTGTTRRFESTKLEREWQRWSPALQRGEVYVPRPTSMGGRGLPTVDEKGHPFDLVDYFLENEVDLFPRAPHDDLLDSGALIWDAEAPPIIYPAPSYRNKSDYGAASKRTTWKSA